MQALRRRATGMQGRGVGARVRVRLRVRVRPPRLRVEEELLLVVRGRAARGAGALRGRRAIRRLPQRLEQRQRSGPLSPGACTSGHLVSRYLLSRYHSCIMLHR